MSCQTIFGTFFLSILAIKRSKHPGEVAADVPARPTPPAYLPTASQADDQHWAQETARGQ